MRKIPGDDLHIGQDSLICLSNSTYIKHSFDSYTDKFDKMNKTNAFRHRLISEGMEESELALAREDIATLRAEYE